MFSEDKFQDINKGYNSTFQAGKLSFGLVSPIENYAVGAHPTMTQDLELIQLAESLGFSAIWLRDIPFEVPSFGDVGQMYDPFVYLGYLAAQTSTIALGTGSIILPLRHPAHVAKSAASIDVLSNGRLILGIASGDRPEEYPAMKLDFTNRGDRFRESYEYIEKMKESNPRFLNEYGYSDGSLDMLPKPYGTKIPLLITGASQQHPDWVATHTDGWITYPRAPGSQKRVIKSWREKAKEHNTHNKPVSQSLYIDLLENDDAMATPIHLGFRCGSKFLLQHLLSLQDAGVNHVVFNLRFNQADTKETLYRLEKILKEF